MDYRKASHEYWNNTWTEYTTYTVDNWLDDFSDIINTATLPILDLGCGNGNDTAYLRSHGKEVIACDQSEMAIRNVRKQFRGIEAMRLNILDGLPFGDNSFEIVVADLSLHYFTKNDTINVLNELKRILKTDGHLLIRVNSINDTNHGAKLGKELEHHLYEVNGMTKRFFDIEDVKEFFKDFQIEYINEELMTRYTRQKWVYKICLCNKVYN